MPQLMDEVMTEEIWKQHCYGLAPSEIAEKLGVSESEVRYTITQFWAMNKRAVKRTLI